MILKPGDRAPHFELPLLRRDNGTRYLESPQSLHKLLARGPAALFFVKRSCPTCHFSLPLLDRLHRNYPDSSVSTLLIAQEDTDSAGGMTEELDLHLPVLLDSEPYLTGEEYGLRFVPTGFYISPEGVIENAFECFERHELEAINRKIAQRIGVPVVPLFEPGDGIPAFRPG